MGDNFYDVSHNLEIINFSPNMSMSHFFAISQKI